MAEITALYTAEFLEIADAMKGDGPFRDGSALIQYQSETDEQYEKRKEVAWYVNDILPACQRFVGYISKRAPARVLENEKLESMADDCDWRGNSLDVFWQDFMLQAKARGSMLLLVDMPTEEQMTSEESGRDFPYLVPIVPERVTKMALDDQGMIQMVEITSTYKGQDAVRGWDSDRWWVKVGGSEIEGDTHGLGICPVLGFSETTDFPALGPFSGIVTLSKRLMNLRSELDEILRRHTFPIFHAQFPILNPVEGETPESLRQRQEGLIGAITGAIAELGANRGIVTPAAAGFIAPPDGPASTYREVIGDLEEKVREIALVPEEPGQGNSQESGIALQIRFQALNGALTAFARRMEDLERRAWYIACKWLALPYDGISVQWSRDYNIADSQTELETLGAMQASAFPARAIQEQMRTVAQLQFSAGDPEAFDAVMESIDEMTIAEELPVDQD